MSVANIQTLNLNINETNSDVSATGCGTNKPNDFTVEPVPFEDVELLFRFALVPAVSPNETLLDTLARTLAEKNALEQKIGDLLVLVFVLLILIDNRKERKKYEIKTVAKNTRAGTRSAHKNVPIEREFHSRRERTDFNTL